jgi:hypothetical protein
MLNVHNAARVGRSFLFVLLAALGLSLTSHAQRHDPDNEKKGMEVFKEVDPYTKGKRELEEKLGYVRLGHGPWHKGVDTKELQMNMGGIEMIFAETEHFRIASSLGTYKVPNNREERDKLKLELKRLKKKLGKFKPPKNELDPWLRLHLYAQRAEDQYEEFCADFGLEEADYSKSGPVLGYPNKTLLIVCHRKSEFGRYVRNYHESTLEYSYRTVLQRDSMVAAANQEALKEGWEMEEEMPFDSMLHNMVAHTLTSCFVDGYKDNMFSAPRWFVYGLSHSHLRRIDPHWTLFDGRKSGQGGDEDQWDWEPRVYKLAKNDFFSSAEDMFAWKKFDELHQRDHMVSWSKTEFLLNELEGDKKAFLADICSASGGFSSNQSDDKLVTRQREAMQEHFGMTPDEFDQAWRKWVLKKYRKR